MRLTESVKGVLQISKLNNILMVCQNSSLCSKATTMMVLYFSKFQRSQSLSQLSCLFENTILSVTWWAIALVFIFTTYAFYQFSRISCFAYHSLVLDIVPLALCVFLGFTTFWYTLLGASLILPSCCILILCSFSYHSHFSVEIFGFMLGNVFLWWASSFVPEIRKHRYCLTRLISSSRSCHSYMLSSQGYLPKL